MAGSYKKFLKAQFDGTESVDVDTDRIDVVLCRTSGAGGTPYSGVDYDADDFLDDIPDNTYARVSTITSVTITTALTTGQMEIKAPAAGYDFLTPQGTDAAHIIVFYKYNATPSSARLLWAINVTVTPDGNTINVKLPSDIIHKYTDTA